MGTMNARIFFAFLSRDLRKDLDSLPSVIAELFLSPLLLLFVFGYILPAIGAVTPGYVELLVPGLAVMAAFSSGISGTAISLLVDFHYTRELEDRLAAPVPRWWVAEAKMVRSAVRSSLGGAVFMGVAWAVAGVPPVRYGAVLPVALVLAAVMGAGVGMTVATSVSVLNIDAVVAALVAFLSFTGCAQYGWSSLDQLVWFQKLTLLNPLTYAAELARSATSAAGLSAATCLCVCVLLTLVTWVVGSHRFARLVTG